jgi:hypothetical protein
MSGNTGPHVPRLNVAKAISFITPARLLTVFVFIIGGRASYAEPEVRVAAPDLGSRTFPDLNEVLQGHAFNNRVDRDVFFLRKIRESYAEFWPSLLEANITVKDYVQAPEKMQRFVEELGTAMEGKNDLAAVTNLAVITSNAIFYANTDAYRPGILQAAASALIKIGPAGRRALAESFSEQHYRADPASLEILAEAIGKSSVSDSRLSAALVATAFTLTATNGGSYPRCTLEVTHSLLSLPDGTSAIASHLTPKEVFKDPGRFQAVVDGIAAANAVELATNLEQIREAVAAKLQLLVTGAAPAAYLEDLSDLQDRITKTIERLRDNPSKSNR